LEQTHCPVLALGGDKDVQVVASANLPRIRAALLRGGNTHIEVRELPGLNHFFQQCTTGSPLEYGVIEQTFSPDALQVIGEWLSTLY
jgi:hypothetical protein